MHDTTDQGPRSDRRTRRARRKGERGIAMMLVGLLLIPMLVFAAFGVDLASWYARISELQRGADAAALAGAVWMPNLSTACARAEDSLLSNDLHPSVTGGTVQFQCRQGSSATALRVTVTDTDADRHFSSIFMSGPAELTRYAEAEYNLPLPLGSPLHYFGGDVTKVPDPPPNYSYTVQWPTDYASRVPFDTVVDGNTVDCNITNNSNLRGRWSGTPPTYSSSGYGSSSPVCGWAVGRTDAAGTSANPPPDYWVRPPTNIQCLVRQGGSGTGTILGVWRSGPDRFSTSTSGTTGWSTCTWTNSNTDASVFSSHPNGSSVVRTVVPQNRPCRVGYAAADGYWPATGSWTTGTPPFAGQAASAGNRLCTWSAEINDTTTDPGPQIDADRSPGFWAQIHGPGGDSNSGDNVNTRCTDQTNSNPCTSTTNLNYLPATDPNQGIWYVIEAPPGGGSVTVSIFDAQLTPGNLSDGTGDSHISGSDSAFATTYRIYRQDNPLDFNVRTALGPNTPDTNDNSCNWSINGHTRFQMVWQPLCTINMAANSTYLLNVRTAERSGFANSAGRNGYAIEACVNNDCDASGQPSIYAYERMVMYNNLSDGDATFYLAEVGPQYAGRTLVIEMWDPGETSGQAWVYPRMPSTSAPRPVVGVPTANCDITSTRSGYPRGSDLNDGGVCSFRSSDGGPLYNGQTVTMRIQIPTSYNCVAGVDPETTNNSCWWGIRYRITGAATDTTTWRARIEGNPLQLTE